MGKSKKNTKVINKKKKNKSKGKVKLYDYTQSHAYKEVISLLENEEGPNTNTASQRACQYMQSLCKGNHVDTCVKVYSSLKEIFKAKDPANYYQAVEVMGSFVCEDPKILKLKTNDQLAYCYELLSTHEDTDSIAKASKIFTVALKNFVNLKEEHFITGHLVELIRAINICTNKNTLDQLKHKALLDLYRDVVDALSVTTYPERNRTDFEDLVLLYERHALNLFKVVNENNNSGQKDPFEKLIFCLKHIIEPIIINCNNKLSSNPRKQLGKIYLLEWASYLIFILNLANNEEGVTNLSRQFNKLYYSLDHRLCAGHEIQASEVKKTIHRKLLSDHKKELSYRYEEICKIKQMLDNLLSHDAPRIDQSPSNLLAIDSPHSVMLALMKNPEKAMLGLEADLVSAKEEMIRQVEVIENRFQDIINKKMVNLTLIAIIN